MIKNRQIDEEIKRLQTATIGTTPQVQAFLEQHNSTLLKSGMTLEELLKRPEICYNDLKEIDTKQTRTARGSDAAGRDQHKV